MRSTPLYRSLACGSAFLAHRGGIGREQTLHTQEERERDDGYRQMAHADPEIVQDSVVGADRRGVVGDREPGDHEQRRERERAEIRPLADRRRDRIANASSRNQNVNGQKNERGGNQIRHG